MTTPCGCSMGSCLCGNGCGGGTCPIMMTILVIGWFLISSGLLYYAWNKVITSLFSAKVMKFWQALLLIFTIAFMISPKYLMHTKHDQCGKGGCHQSSSGPCPMMQNGRGPNMERPSVMPQ